MNIFFLSFFNLVKIFFAFLDSLRLLEFWISSGFVKIFFKVTKVNVTEVTTEHQKRPKMSTNNIKSNFFARRPKKAQSKAEALPRIGK